jgi:glycosyltransferase involved in cell wall biosynthesis
MEILIASRYYFPGWKCGGAARAVFNLIEALGDEYRFRVVTSDRDLGDTHPFPDACRGRWVNVGKADVLYMSPGKPSIADWRNILRKTPYDILYLTSFFSQRFTIYPLLLSKLGLVPPRPILIAPKGEFARGAIAQKAYKKNPYLLATRLTKFCDGLAWQASSREELNDIETTAPKSSDRYQVPAIVVPDLVRDIPSSSIQQDRAKFPGELRVAFLSRICKGKNLLGALQALLMVKSKLEFDIYGPVEDEPYWRECTRLIEAMPANVLVRYRGPIEPEKVIPTLSTYHLFFLPTLGENFGYTIVEAMLAGCPVLISDKTPWKNLSQQGVGWDIPLREYSRYATVLDNLASVDINEYHMFSKRSRDFARDIVTKLNAQALSEYRRMFATIHAGRHKSGFN